MLKNIKKILIGFPEDDATVQEFLGKIDSDTLLQKQLTAANGGIPNQVHAREMKVILKNETQMDFEMQVTAVSYWTKRILFYLGKMYTDQLKAGESYDKLKKCIHVGILDLLHFPDDDRCYRKIIFCDKDTGKEYTDLLEIHVLELKKLPEKEQNESGIIRWMRFLGAKSRKEFEKMAKEDSYIGEAYEMLKHMSADEKKRLEYEAREKAIRDYHSQMQASREEGRKEGREEGKKEGVASIITNMLRKGKVRKKLQI